MIITTNIIALIIVLGVLVFIHEFGHFIIARLFGVGVEKFSFGFGPRLFGKKIGMTDYRVSAIPLGGYVKMVGDEPGMSIPEEMIPYAFNYKSVYKRMAIVFAGPLFNVILAIVIYWVMFSIYGVPDRITSTIIGNISDNSPAANAGLKVQDKIEAINGKTISGWSEMTEIIKNSNGNDTAITVKRGNDSITVNLRPELKTVKNEFGEDIKRYLIGITASSEVRINQVTIIGALHQSLKHCWDITKLVSIGLVKIIQGKISSKELSGPIAIAKEAGARARGGIPYLIEFIALISLNLAILNLLPIPVLDGGHLFFYSIEALKGSPVSESTRMTAQQIGLLILLTLMIFAFYNDLTRKLPM